MDLQEHFGVELGRISRGWRARLDERLRHTGLTQSRWHTLWQLARGGDGITQRELAARVGVEGPTLGRLLDALAAQGLIERRAANDDRRAYHVHLTPAAQPILAEISRIATGLRRELLADIPADELGTCLDVLRRIGARLEKR